MPYNITGRIPPAVWWLVGIGVLLISIALAINILASDSVSVGVDGIDVQSAPMEIPEPPADNGGQQQIKN